MKLEHLQDEKYEFAAPGYAGEIPDYVLDMIPKCYRETITGAVFEIIEGELGEVWLTESSRPYELRANYYTPEYWQPEIEHFGN